MHMQPCARAWESQQRPGSYWLTCQLLIFIFRFFPRIQWIPTVILSCFPESWMLFFRFPPFLCWLLKCMKSDGTVHQRHLNHAMKLQLTSSSYRPVDLNWHSLTTHFDSFHKIKAMVQFLCQCLVNKLLNYVFFKIMNFIAFFYDRLYFVTLKITKKHQIRY